MSSSIVNRGPGVIQESIGAIAVPEAADGAAPAALAEGQAGRVEQATNHVENQGLKVSAPRSHPRGPTQVDRTVPLFQSVLHHHVSNVLEGRLGNFLTWVPFTLVISVASTNHPLLALWLAFGVSTILVVVEFYHGSQKPKKYSRYSWLTVAPWITYLVLGLVYAVQPYSWTLIGAVASSVLLAALLSQPLDRPFNLQQPRERVPPEVAVAPEFRRLHVQLTLYWLVLFGTVAASSWAAHSLPDDDSAGGTLVRGTVIPIAVPIAGVVTMPAVVEHLQRSSGGAA